MKRGSQLTLKIDGIKFPSTGVSECEGTESLLQDGTGGECAV